MKRIKNLTPQTFDGGSFLLPVYGPDRKPIQKDGVWETKESNLKEILELVVKHFPQKHMTMDNVTHANALFRSLKKAGEYIELDDDTHKWLLSTLENNDIGVAMYAMNIEVIIDAVKDVVKDGT